jgi:class 3 adenylate cyclase
VRVREGLPSGLVTFVMTDIEGSTKLLRRLGDRYPFLLDTHNSMLREQWISYGGVEIGTAGDSFVVVFQSAMATSAPDEGQVRRQ